MTLNIYKDKGIISWHSGSILNTTSRTSSTSAQACPACGGLISIPCTIPAFVGRMYCHHLFCSAPLEVAPDGTVHDMRPLGYSIERRP